MADNHSREVRSYNMSQIKAKNTKPEIIVRKILFKQGYRFRLHSKDLPGCPDIVLPKFKTVIFVHGCFWHGHYGCRYFKAPKTNIAYWTEKIIKNRERDILNEVLLKNDGWKVIVIWECEIKNHQIECTIIKNSTTIR